MTRESSLSLNEMPSDGISNTDVHSLNSDNSNTKLSSLKEEEYDYSVNDENRKPKNRNDSTHNLHIGDFGSNTIIGSILSNSSHRLYSSSTSQLKQLPEKISFLLDHPERLSFSAAANLEKPLSQAKHSSSSSIRQFLGTKDAENVNGKYSRRSSTSSGYRSPKVMAITETDETINWNILPTFGTRIIPSSHSLNITHLTVNGELKQVLYDPTYNANFRKFNIFLLFNLDSNKMDPIVNARKRLQSYIQFTTQYLKTRKYARQCYPFNDQTDPLKVVKNQLYELYVTGHDYLESEMLISLWCEHAHKALRSSNSIFFSSEVAEYLLEKKIRATPSIDKHDKDVHISGNSKSVDVVFLRIGLNQNIAWQLAYDEPTLNIVDYCIDFLPWIANDENVMSLIHNSQEQHKISKELSSETLNIVNDESEIKTFNNETLENHLLDCMDRPVMSLKGEHYGPKSSSSTGSLKSDTYSLSNHAAINDKEIQNKWLEDYFNNYMTNYKRVNLPTQYMIPKTVKDSLTDSTEIERQGIKKTASYIRESLKLKLPFDDDSIPTMYCPYFWSGLSLSRWLDVLDEIMRCTVPGGYVLAQVYDLKLTNKSFDKNSKDPSEFFQSTIDRDKSYEILSRGAYGKKLSVYPTRHLRKAFEDAGFINIKNSMLFFETGDFSTSMGCINEFVSILNWDFAMRKNIGNIDTDEHIIDPSQNLEKYSKEHMYRTENDIGGVRSLYVVAQKPQNKVPTTNTTKET